MQAERIATQALRDWLLLSLPAKVTEVNLTRAASVMAPYAGPYVFSAGATIGICRVADSDTFNTVNLTTGSRTTAQVVTEINIALGAAVASADAVSDRLILTSLIPPTTSAASAVLLRGDGTSTDANTVFGWDAGGEKCVRTALVAPGSRGITDGLPLQPDFGPSGAGGGSPIIVIIGDRASKPVGPMPTRRDEYAVVIDLSILRVEPQQQAHRDREHIHAAVQCVRELLVTQSGLMLGQRGNQSVKKVTELSCRVSALPFKFKDNKDSPIVSPLFDGAAMSVEVRVYEQQGAA